MFRIAQNCQNHRKTSLWTKKFLLKIFNFWAILAIFWPILARFWPILGPFLSQTQAIFEDFSMKIDLKNMKKFIKQQKKMFRTAQNCQNHRKSSFWTKKNFEFWSILADFGPFLGHFWGHF